jgi:hypothetical protein
MNRLSSVSKKSGAVQWEQKSVQEVTGAPKAKAFASSQFLRCLRTRPIFRMAERVSENFQQAIANLNPGAGAHFKNLKAVWVKGTFEVAPLVHPTMTIMMISGLRNGVARNRSSVGRFPSLIFSIPFN